MNLKRIGILTFLFMMLIPVSSSFAEIVSSPEPYHYENGLLDDDFIIENHNLEDAFFDNDLDTEAKSDKNYFINFSKPVYIDQMFSNNRRSGGSGIVTFSFIDSEDEKLKEISKQSSNGFTDVDVENVIQITFLRTSASGSNYISEIDFFGSYDKEDEIPEGIQDPPQNIDFSVTNSTASF